MPFYIENENFARLKCFPIVHANYLQPWICVLREDAEDAPAMLERCPPAKNAVLAAWGDQMPKPWMRRFRIGLVRVATGSAPSREVQRRSAPSEAAWGDLSQLD